MTHATCPDCGLRFSPAFAALSRSCPMCCAPLQFDATAEQVIGQQLYFEPAQPMVAPPSWDGR